VHYAYANAGGGAPNVVPDHAKVKYEVRAPKVKQMKQLFERVVKVAEGAAHMTETRMEYEITMAFSDMENNSVLAKIASECLQEVGAPAWDEEDYALAKAFLESYDETSSQAIRENLRNEFGAEHLDEILEKPLHILNIGPYLLRSLLLILFSLKFPAGSLHFPQRIDFIDLLYRFKQPGTARDPKRLE
jgi:aminobenzoyl-glutamate utilization protein B